MVSTYLKLQYCAKVLSCNMHLFNCSLTHMPNHSITWQQFSVFQRKMARLLQVNRKSNNHSKQPRRAGEHLWFHYTRNVFPGLKSLSFCCNIQGQNLTWITWIHPTSYQWFRLLVVCVGGFLSHLYQLSII